MLDSLYFFTTDGTIPRQLHEAGNPLRSERKFGEIQSGIV